MDPFTIDKPAQRWLFKTAQKNYWRVQSWYDLDDLIQDGYMTWCMVADRYADSVRLRCQEQPESKRSDAMLSIMMALFTRCYINHIHDLASRRNRLSETVISDLAVDDQSHESYLDGLLASQATTIDEVELVNCAPDGIREVLQLYTNEPDSPKISASFRVRSDGSRETLNERLCRLVGCDPSTNLSEAVRCYLKGDGSEDGLSVV